MIMSASPGGLGGMRGLVHLRAILGNINVCVLPQTLSISQAMKAFNEDGSLVDEKKQKAVEGLGAALTEMVSKVK